MNQESLSVMPEYETVGALMSSEDKLYLYHLRRHGLQQGEHLDRRVAAHILALVAEAGQTGNATHRVTPELIGAATRRLVSNYGDDWLEKFMRGLSR